MNLVLNKNKRMKIKMSKWNQFRRAIKSCVISSTMELQKEKMLGSCYNETHSGCWMPRVTQFPQSLIVPFKIPNDFPVFSYESYNLLGGEKHRASFESLQKISNTASFSRRLT